MQDIFWLHHCFPFFPPYWKLYCCKGQFYLLCWPRTIACTVTSLGVVPIIGEGHRRAQTLITLSRTVHSLMQWLRAWVYLEQGTNLMNSAPNCCHDQRRSRSQCSHGCGVSKPYLVCPNSTQDSVLGSCWCRVRNKKWTIFKSCENVDFVLRMASSIAQCRCPLLSLQSNLLITPQPCMTR